MPGVSTLFLTSCVPDYLVVVVGLVASCRDCLVVADRVLAIYIHFVTGGVLLTGGRCGRNGRLGGDGVGVRLRQ